jgi:hypothetical protein
MESIPYYEKIMNQYLSGEITKEKLHELCKEDEKLRKWAEYHFILAAAIKDLKPNL